MKLILSHPTGNANVRAAADGFYKADHLSRFYTSVAVFSGSFLDNIGALKPLAEVRRRSFNMDLKPVTKVSPWLEFGRIVASKAGLSELVRHEKGILSIDAVYQDIDKRVAASLKYAIKEGIGAVYAYDDGALNSFRTAKKLGVKCLYDLPTGYWRAARELLEKEKDRWPDWVSTITGFKDSVYKLSCKDEELRLADAIFVASRFTANTLQYYPGPLAPIHVIPYGFPAVYAKREYLRAARRRLKVLFVGKLSQQKGVADLFAAVEGFQNFIDLTLVGHKACNNCKALDVALEKHTWIPSLPHKDILKLMRENDLLVFPSLFDGFGLVITEAMSQGTPVITTERTAGPDLIEDGCNGWLVSAGSVSTLRNAIEKLLLRPKLIAETGRAAMESARIRPWEVYGQELAKALGRV
ncbi:glycosyltransferase family 4 protein [Nafulsella turpanensis]|uniref:glycosyltransferase family 4 protein n=1 Tax=Nafulsella turpanensis TaxID=1265690 RepID=UPI00034DBAEB|nr:glycosyltransferase family 4 protein [Nafulsella turpanensis]